MITDLGEMYLEMNNERAEHSIYVLMLDMSSFVIDPFEHNESITHREILEVLMVFVMTGSTYNRVRESILNEFITMGAIINDDTSLRRLYDKLDDYIEDNVYDVSTATLSGWIGNYMVIREYINEEYVDGD